MRGLKFNDIPLEISEANWQNTVVLAAKTYGWELIYHTWNSKNSPAGFPDLILLKGNRMIVAELKKEGKLSTLTAEQYFWLVGFSEITPDVFVWMPSDWEQVVEVLSGQPIKEPEYSRELVYAD